MFKGAGVNGVKDMKDWMRGKVTCRQCHTSVKQGKKESAASIKTACAACHGKKYLTLVDDWIAQNKNVPMQFRDKLSTIEKKMDAIETKDKSHSVPMRGVLDEINQDMHFVFDGNWAHNPQYAEAIVAKISKNIQTLEGMIKAKEAGQPIIIQTKQNTDTKAQPQKK
jgi:cytochrome c553